MTVKHRLKELEKKAPKEVKPVKSNHTQEERDLSMEMLAAALGFPGKVEELKEAISCL